MNSYDLNTELGWLAASDLATKLGWRDGYSYWSFNKMTGKELNKVIKISANLTNCTRGHVEELRRVYGAAYYAAKRVSEKQLEQKQ